MIKCTFCKQDFSPRENPPSRLAITCDKCVKKYYSGAEPDTELHPVEGARPASARSRRSPKPKETAKENTGVEPVEAHEAIDDDVEQGTFRQPDEQLHHHGEDD
jgi:hypothetical protein